MPDMYYTKNERPRITTFPNNEKGVEKFNAQRGYVLTIFGVFGEALKHCSTSVLSQTSLVWYKLVIEG